MNDNAASLPISRAAVERPRILIVDDAPDNLSILFDALKDDYTIIAALNGPMALKMAAATPRPDLILLDIVMPEMNGYQVCAHLQERAETRAIPVIFLTALEEEESETQGLSLGAVDFIRKPIRFAALHLRVKLTLELFQSRQRLEEQNRQLIAAARLREDIEHITRHDLKGPLSIIIGVPQLLLQQCKFNDSQRELVTMIEESGYSMLGMINLSLDLYKMENGIYNFFPEQIDILPIMRRALAEVAPMVSAKSLQIALRVNTHPPIDGQQIMVMAESLLCHSMFSNLCKNAAEASSREGVINIDFDIGARATVSIENGGEVPMEIRDHFFDKYVTSGKPDGTGLGTYSAGMIARAQKGTIALDTTVAGRTCLKITLPIGVEPQDEQITG